MKHIRVLIAIAPAIYRETLALTIWRHRPHVEVIIGTPERLDREVARLQPDLVVCNEITASLKTSVGSWVQVLYSDSLDTIVSVGGRESRLEDVNTEDLLAIVDEAGELSLSG